MINAVTDEFVVWASEVLPATQQAMLIKLREEVEEFFEDPSDLEAADIIFVLCRWCEAQGIDLNAALERKFAIVQAREWHQLDDGTWKHKRVASSVL